MYNFTSPPDSRAICQNPTASPHGFNQWAADFTIWLAFFAWTADGDKEVVGVTSSVALESFIIYCKEARSRLSSNPRKLVYSVWFN